MNTPAFRRTIPTFTILDDGRYRLGTDYTGMTALRGYDLDTPYCTLYPNGVLMLKSGFVWDGPTFAFNTDDTFMPSALHDCLCDLHSDGWLPDETRVWADYTYRDALRTWRVPAWRRALHFRGVRLWSTYRIATA